jgi:hypothetical protein
MPMKRSEIDELPYLKTISDFGIDFSLDTLIKRGYIVEKVIDRHSYRTEEYKRKYGEVVRYKYCATKEGRKYLQEHGYFD